MKWPIQRVQEYNSRATTRRSCRTTPKVVIGREFYIPHKGVTRENAESMKLRIMYDASAREKDNQPSLNDCLNLVPPLHNHLWDILVRSRFYPVLLTGDHW